MRHACTRQHSSNEAEERDFVSVNGLVQTTDSVEARGTAISHSQALGLTVFENVIPSPVLEKMNATIDADRATWPAPDGGIVPLARKFGEMLRGMDRFRELESESRAKAKDWAAAELRGGYSEDSLHVLRCVNHEMDWQSHLRHHDSHFLTLLIPLKLADGTERNGDLLLYERRRQSVTFIGNMAYKTWLVSQQNRRFAVRARQTRRDLAAGRCHRISCVPGNVYVFNGFLSLHANLEIESGERRSLIVHHFDPHLTAGIKHVTRGLRLLRRRHAD